MLIIFMIAYGSIRTAFGDRKIASGDRKIACGDLVNVVVQEQSKPDGFCLIIASPYKKA